MKLLISWSSLPPSLGLCQNFLTWVDFPEKNGIHLFPAFPSNRIPLSNKWAMCTGYRLERWTKTYAAWTQSLLYLFFDMGTPEFSSLAPSHHSDLRANVPSSEGSLLTSIKPLPSPMTRYACYAFMASAALFPSEIILLSGCLYVMSIFPSLTSMWACRERESCQSQSPLCLHHKEPAWQVISTW